jgi:hypothetical protein
MPRTRAPFRARVAPLNCVQTLSERQVDALASLDAATNDRLNAISVATQQGIINLYQVSTGWGLAGVPRVPIARPR